MKSQLSVIVSNYNHARYLDGCFKSLLEQSFSDFEIIICDDCSTDDSKVIIEKYRKEDVRIVPLYQPVNMGVSANRHAGVLKSEGKYLTTLDSDDIYCHPDKLKEEFKLLRFYEERHQTICAFSRILRLDDKLNYIRDQWPASMIKEGNIFKEIFARTHFIPRDFTYLREAYFEAGGYDPHFNLYEDWDLKIRLAAKYEFYFTGIDGTGYRKKGEGLSYAPSGYHIKALRGILAKNTGLIVNEQDKAEIISSIEIRIKKLELQ